MGQKTHPVGFRIGITEDHKSKWFAPKKAYGEFLVEGLPPPRVHRQQAQPPAPLRGGQRDHHRAYT